MDSDQNIKEKSQQMVTNLLNASKQLCINKISNNIYYIKSFVKEKDQQSSFFKVKKRRLQDFINRNRLSIDELVTEIVKYQSDIIWIDFILYFSSEKETIILVEFIFGKNNSQLDYHASIITPLHNQMNDQRFDLNWYYNSSDPVRGDL